MKIMTRVVRTDFGRQADLSDKLDIFVGGVYESPARGGVRASGIA